MSQHEAAKKEIGGHQFEMYMLPPLKSHDLLVDVAKMIGPAIGPIIDALINSSQKSSLSLSDLMASGLGSDFFEKAAKALFSGLDKKILHDVITAFKQVTHRDGAPIDRTFDEIFRGELGDMHAWLFWGMKVQWGKSFGALNIVLDGFKRVQGAEPDAPK